MSSSVLGLAGGIASGKSTLSEALSRTLHCRRASFGGFVRELAKARGLPARREVWQQLGQELIQAGVREFCVAVLRSGGWESGDRFIIDGIRHKAVAVALREIVKPSDFRLIYVSVPAEVRSERLKSANTHGLTLAEMEEHPTELDVRETLPDLADLIVNGELPVDVLIGQILHWKRQLGTATSPHVR